MKRLTATLVAGAVVLLAAPVLTGAVVVTALVNDGAPSDSTGAAVPAVTTIPADMLTAYRRAASACPGLSWTVLAAIGTIESDNGQARLPGVASGQNAAGAAGPMQFEAATFARF